MIFRIKHEITKNSLGSHHHPQANFNPEQHLVRKVCIKEVFLNRDDNWIYCGFLYKNKSAGYSYEYVQLVKLGFNEEKEAAV